MTPTSSKKSFAVAPATQWHLIRVELRSLGHICSFKNTKMLARGRLITDPKKQKQMDAITLAIESALRSAFQIAEDGMRTGQSLPSWIASHAPLDDSLDWIPESSGWRVERVPKGEEGMDFTIVQLP